MDLSLRPLVNQQPRDKKMLEQEQGQGQGRIEDGQWGARWAEEDAVAGLGYGKGRVLPQRRRMSIRNNIKNNNNNNWPLPYMP